MKKHLIIALLLLAATAAASNIAVLEITISDAPSEEEGEAAELSVSETKFLTDELRRQAATILQKEHTVLTREQIIGLIPENAELHSALEIGRAIKSSFVTNGTISKLGNLFTLKVELFECENGTLIGDLTGESQDLKGLMNVIRSDTPKLFKKLVKEEETKPEPLKVTVEVKTAPQTNIEQKTKTSTWVAIGFDALGAIAFGIGIYNHIQATNDYDKYSKLPPEEYDARKSEYKALYREVKDAQTVRNISLTVGSVLLLSGITVHVLF
ncbi:hypothetical protein R83H12_02918 [Fibrobacteria bacterium R8-3-H12]